MTYFNNFSEDEDPVIIYRNPSAVLVDLINRLWDLEVNHPRIYGEDFSSGYRSAITSVIELVEDMKKDSIDPRPLDAKS